MGAYRTGRARPLRPRHHQGTPARQRGPRAGPGGAGDPAERLAEPRGGHSLRPGGLGGPGTGDHQAQHRAKPA